MCVVVIAAAAAAAAGLLLFSFSITFFFGISTDRTATLWKSNRQQSIDFTLFAIVEILNRTHEGKTKTKAFIRIYGLTMCERRGQSVFLSVFRSLCLPFTQLRSMSATRHIT